ncbi:AarF/UbiB family protein [Pseudomonas sp. 10B238]|uniref:AarF/UbiB family protein n=1 Tax=Pseudomonas sp. 10B238 TaxID=1586417 RepID=UPI0006962D47|nr:lipopolysaccharide kinase InaA family protein [Pseudomonas sp. 10B238]
MLYWNRYIRDMDRVVFPKHIFHLDSTVDDERRQLAAFLSAKQLSCLKAPVQGRAVYLMEEKRVVLKTNRLGGLKKRLIKHFGLFGGGRHYCLTNELANLRRLSKSKLVPQVYGFGRQRHGLLRDEFLLIEYFHSMQTVDEFIVQYPARLEWVLEKVVDLFYQMLMDGFVHLDPHPGNILLDDAGRMRFIDFESCSFDVSDDSFVLASSLGYFFHYWFCKFIDETVYDQIVLHSLAKRGSSKLDARFFAIYQSFKKSKVSRRQRYDCLFSPAYRRKFETACSVSPDTVRTLRNRAEFGMGDE